MTITKPVKCLHYGIPCIAQNTQRIIGKYQSFRRWTFYFVSIASFLRDVGKKYKYAVMCIFYLIKRLRVFQNKPYICLTLNNFWSLLITIFSLQRVESRASENKFWIMSPYLAYAWTTTSSDTLPLKLDVRTPDESTPIAVREACAEIHSQPDRRGIGEKNRNRLRHWGNTGNMGLRDSAEIKIGRVCRWNWRNEANRIFEELVHSALVTKLKQIPFSLCSFFDLVRFR